MRRVVEDNKMILAAILVVGILGALVATQTDVVNSVTETSGDQHGDAMHAQGDAMEAEGDAMETEEDAMDSEGNAMESENNSTEK